MKPLIPVPGLAIEQQPEAVLRRMCAWAEARGEGPLGQLAVLWVVRNRAQRQRKSEAEVILAPLQFSSFNASDPNRVKLLTAYRDDPASWASTDAVVTLLESMVTHDPTLGSDHYYNPLVAAPVWGRGSVDWHENITIGAHVFGNCA